MKMTEIKDKARALGVKIRGLRKADLIRQILIAEGNQPCFLAKAEPCMETDCCWRKDCFS